MGGISIAEARKQIAKVRQGLTRTVNESVKNTSTDLLDLNREQLMTGQNANGEKLPAYRSKPYARRKATLNPLPGFGTPDLSLTGAFQKALTIDVSRREITSKDKKEPFLSKRYGSNIYGLTEDNTIKYWGVLAPVLRGNIVKQTTFLFINP